VIQKQKYKNNKQEHEMCKTSEKTNFYYVNIYKHNHERTLFEAMVFDHA
jgi:hypothetical protein